MKNINGYEIRLRNDGDIATEGDNVIYYWAKANGYKCDGYSNLGYYSQGLGETLQECIDSLFTWFTSLDQDHRNCTGNIGDLEDALKDYDKDLKLKIKTNFGILQIDSIDDTHDGIIYLNTNYDFRHMKEL